LSGRLGPLFAGLRDRLSERLFPPPLDTAEALGRFVGERAAYVAQTTLYGYLKTRMGMKFPRYFEDPGFAAEIRAASVRLFASCAADLAIHAAAVAGAGGRLGAAEQAALARACFAAALGRALGEGDAAAVPAQSAEAFAARAWATDWAEAAIGEAAFAGSAADLARVAPVTEEFKRLDRPIVRNSIRFAWRDVRAELARRLDPAAVAGDWRARRDG
jgi:hypothetical protein